MAEHQVLSAQPATRDEQLRHDLLSWATLQGILTTLSETEAYMLMEQERMTAKRPRVILRLYSRYSLKRKERELAELGGGAWPF